MAVVVVVGVEAGLPLHFVAVPVLLDLVSASAAVVESTAVADAPAMLREDAFK